MIERMAHLVAKYLVRNGADKSNYEVYVYALECLFNTGITTCILFIYAFSFQKVPDVILWILGYMPIRTNIGGLHASTHFRCILMSTIICIVSINICGFLHAQFMLVLVLLIGSTILIIFNQPIVNPNGLVTDAQRKQSKMKFFIWMFIDVMVWLFWGAKIEVISFLIAGILSAMILYCIKLIMKRISIVEDLDK